MVPTRAPVPVMLALLAALGLPGCAGGDASGTAFAPASGSVDFFAAASTTNALDEVAARFGQAHAVEVRANYAASSTLAHQIENGAAADVFLSANEKWADYLEARGLVARRQNLLGNRLVVIVPADSQLSIAKVEDLEGEKIERLALADSDAVPAGMYAKEALVKLGLWDRLKKKVVAADDVRRALMFVETGNAQAGIVYSTDAAISGAVKVAVPIDPGLTQPIRYPLVLLAKGADRPAAVSWFDYLTGPEAAEVFRKHGFTVLDSPAAAKK